MSKEGAEGPRGQGAEGLRAKRLFWIDWGRTQAVWNVACGHCWWTTLDRFGMEHPVVSPRNEAPWNEPSRMLEYTVDQGALFTIPLFFLVSGVLASKTLQDRLGPGVWLMRRMYRIVPPFLTGAIVVAIERNAADYDKGFKDIMISRIWFLWALFAIQFVTFPFCMAIRLCRNGEAKSQKFALWLGGHVLITIVIILVFEAVMKVGSGGRFWWVATFPLITSLVLIFYAVGGHLTTSSGGQSALGHWLKVFTVFLMGFSTFLLAVHKICPIPDCGEWDSLSVNTIQALVVVVICYLTGFLATESVDSIEAVASGTPLQGLAVLAFLLSSYWPVFTFWGEQFIRKNAWLMTYQEDQVYPLSPTPPLEPERMPGGMGPAWAMARMWFWIFAMLLFGKGFCDHEVHPWLHRHITQSSVVVFIFHRCFDVHLSEWLKESGVNRPEEMVIVLIILVFACCFAVYAVLVQIPVVAFAFGIRDIDLNKNILPCFSSGEDGQVKMKDDSGVPPGKADSGNLMYNNSLEAGITAGSGGVIMEANEGSQSSQC